MKIHWIAIFVIAIIIVATGSMAVAADAQLKQQLLTIESLQRSGKTKEAVALIRVLIHETTA
ncbi:MAG: hypothetical protein ACRD3W_11115, partial [Terriglobales bacterium]